MAEGQGKETCGDGIEGRGCVEVIRGEDKGLDGVGRGIGKEEGDCGRGYWLSEKGFVAGGRGGDRGVNQ